MIHQYKIRNNLELVQQFWQYHDRGYSIIPGNAIIGFQFSKIYHIGLFQLYSCLCPYHGEITESFLISKVEHRRAWVVLGWVTTWEVQVL